MILWLASRTLPTVWSEATLQSDNQHKPELVARQEWQRVVVELAKALSPEQKAQAREALYKASAVRPR